MLLSGRNPAVSGFDFPGATTTTMQTRIPRINSTHRLGCILLLFTIGVFSLPAHASSALEQPLPPDPQVARVSPDTLPDAPSALHSAGSQPAGGSVNIPLEQQVHPPVTVAKLPINILRDGVNIAVSPAYLRTNDLKWLLPLAGASAAAFATDTRAMTQVVSSNPSFNQTSINVSNVLVGGLIATPIALFGVGEFRKNDRARETGLLGSEAMVDAFVVDQVVKLCTFRERPLSDNGKGEFYIGKAGPDSSFVSAHSMVAWSSAAVIAGEYPSKWVQLGVYTAAAGVSATRVMGQQHFPSDVLIGAAGGWLIGHYVFRAHHHLPLEHRAN
jgi:membrane-associated phospholipid phosphatase